MEGEMLKGHLDLIVLAALSAGPAHGYAVIEAIRLRSGRRSIFRRGRSTPRCIVSSRQVFSAVGGSSANPAASGGSMR
jgi:hypothetical protein